VPQNRNVSYYARTVNCSGIKVFGSLTEIVNPWTADFEPQGLSEVNACVGCDFPASDKAKRSCLASSRICLGLQKWRRKVKLCDFRRSVSYFIQ
jgi:hypothetical protein